MSVVPESRQAVLRVVPQVPQTLTFSDLADYTTGTWAITLSDGTLNAGLSGQSAQYWRYGLLCFIEFDMIVVATAGMTGANLCQISLPFARAGGSASSSSGTIGYITHLTAGDMTDQVALRVDGTNNVTYMIKSAATSVGAGIRIDELNSSGSFTSIRASMWYPVAPLS